MSYDRIAPYYDTLSRIVFFRAQIRAQIRQLAYIPANSKILIVGGGTGWILEEITHLYPSGLQITYIENSVKMMELSRKRILKENKIIYLHTAIEEFVFHEQYDIVITAFLFDNFSAEKIKAVFGKLNASLNVGGLWFFSDFHISPDNSKRWWHQYLLQLMYCFFKYVASIEAKGLINLEDLFKENTYVELQTASDYGSFIKSIVYQKQ